MSFKAEKYNQEITLNCPICGNTQMSIDDENEKATCSDCGTSFEYDQIIAENGENINSYVNDMKEKVKKDLAKEFSDTLKKAFKGSKNIRIK